MSSHPSWQTLTFIPPVTCCRHYRSSCRFRGCGLVRRMMRAANSASVDRHDSERTDGQAMLTRLLFQGITLLSPRIEAKLAERWFVAAFPRYSGLHKDEGMWRPAQEVLERVSVRVRHTPSLTLGRRAGTRPDAAESDGDSHPPILHLALLFPCRSGSARCGVVGRRLYQPRA